ncbi:MAG TPA: hypothetical protein VHW65_04390 [Gemmatimonadales bacterium]|jgi:hypothetical protein|nr:hypothetical protein [Gemmatimonadales bacterium]
MTELAAPQISSLMEALPGIAAVLRSPVANAMVAVSRAAAGLEEFQLSHAEELLEFGVRRNLLTQEEVGKVLGELREVAASRPSNPVVVEKPKKLTPVPQAVKPLEMRPNPMLSVRPKPAPLAVKGSMRPPMALSTAPKKPPAKVEPPKAKVVAPVKKAAPPAPKKVVAKPQAKPLPAKPKAPAKTVAKKAPAKRR